MGRLVTGKKKKVLIYCGINNLINFSKHRTNFDVCYGFDANPDKVEHAIKVYQNDPHVHIIYGALTGHGGEEVEFTITTDWDPASTLGKLNPGYIHVKNGKLLPQKKIKVPTINLADFCRDNDIREIDLLLTDLQGMDLSVLQTLKQFIRERRIQEIQCEVETDDTPPIHVDLPSNKLADFQTLLADNYDLLWRDPEVVPRDWWEMDVRWRAKPASSGADVRPRESAVINIVYEYLKPEQEHAVHCGTVSVVWSPLPLKGCDIYAYLNASSYRGKQNGREVLLMLEPIVVLPGEYNKDVWDHFDHVFTLCDALVDCGGKFTKILFPRSNWIVPAAITENREVRQQQYPLEGRANAICMINGNKHSFIVSELYSKRVEAAQWFHHNSDMRFDVFGNPPFSLPNYRGALAVDAKLSTLSKYRYCLCFENTNHPTFSSGYVTEKILDCFETRTIPIYFGSVNIDDYIPQECFIDMRNFRSYDDLHVFLHSLSTEHYNRIIESVDSWVANGGLRHYSWFTIYDQLSAILTTPANEHTASSPFEPSRWQPGIAPASQGHEWIPVSGESLWSWQSLARGTSALLAEAGAAGEYRMQAQGHEQTFFPRTRRESITLVARGTAYTSKRKLPPVQAEEVFISDMKTDLKQHVAEYYKVIISHNQADSDRAKQGVHEVWKRQLSTLGALILNGLPENFLLHPICLEMFVRTGWHLPQEHELTFLEQLDKKLQAKIFSLKESPIGAVPRDCKNHPISVNTLGMLWYFARIHEQLIKSPVSIIEFGGGFGSLARVYKSLGRPELTYSIIDLPEMLALQYYYLTGTLGTDAVAAHVSADEKTVPGKINLFPVYGVESLDVTGDLFISTFALSETPAVMQNVVCSAKNYFNAPFVYVTGQYATERSELGWQPPHMIMQSAQDSRSTVKIGRFHIGDNYELMASGLKKPDKRQHVPASAGAGKKIVSVLFSKDRAMQLDGTLKSFFLHCTDAALIALKVLYTTSSPCHEDQYQRLQQDYHSVEFISETSFKSDLLSLLASTEQILFLVDDNIFIRPFLIAPLAAALSQQPDLLGCSLRLGKNTTYCYMLNKPQTLPSFEPTGNGLLKYDWTRAECDFGYPLELSSSLYRTADLLPLLKQVDFMNPNTLEASMDANKAVFQARKPALLCFESSIAFCNPVNKVQTVFDNKSGVDASYSPDKIAELFNQGFRIDLAPFENFTPNSCHQEVNFQFAALSGERERLMSMSDGSYQPLVSIVILNYNGREHLPPCLESIQRNTPERHEIIIIDNASTDGSKEYLRSLTNIILVENQTNVGCPPARAQAMSLAKGDYLIFLDNDTIVTSDWAKTFIDHAKANPQIGIMGPRSNYVSGTQLVPNVPYRDISGLEQFASDFTAKQRGQLTETTRLVGFCMFIRREVIEKIGNIDASFGKFGFEDDDYTWRAHIAGFSAAIANDVFIHHTGGPQGRGNQQYNQLLFEAWDIFKRKWELPVDLKYGTPFDLSRVLARPFDPTKHFIAMGGQPARSASLHDVQRLSPANGSRIEKVPGQVSIVIRFSQELEKAKKCYHAVKKYTGGSREIIALVPGSAAPVVKWAKKLARESHSFKFKETADARSFSSENNLGIQESSGEYLLLLEDSVLLTHGSLPRMLDCLNNTSSPGIIGPMSDAAGGPQQVTCPDCATADLLDKFARDFQARRRHCRVVVESVSGLCLLFTGDLAGRIGLFDESLEPRDIAAKDYCLRAALAGFTNSIAGDAFVHGTDASATLTGSQALLEKWKALDLRSAKGQKFIALKAIEKARELFEKDLIDQSITELMDGIARASGEKLLYTNLAAMMIESKRFQDALDAIRATPDETQNDAESILLSGYAQEGLGLLEEASACAERVLERKPGSGQALNLKGLVAYKKGDHHAAEKFFAQATDADPGYGDPCTSLGFLQWAAGQQETALDLFERGCMLSPTSPDIISAYHSAVTATGAFARAEKILQDAKGLHPRNRRIAFLLIDVLIRQEKYDLAMQEIEQAMVLTGIDDGMLAAALEIRSKIGQSVRPAGGAPSISLCMIVKNEEQHLAKCLLSVKPIVQEMIVVDTGSTDRTRDIAAAVGASVYDFPWTSDFAAARNFSLSMASGRWILVMDADEVLSDLDYGFFEQFLRDPVPAPAAYVLNTRNYTTVVGLEGWSPNDDRYFRESAGCGWVPSAKVRLFPHDEAIRFENPVHEIVEPSILKKGLPVKSCDVPVHHYGRLDQDKLMAKHEHYYELGKKKLEEKGNDPKALRELAIQAAELQKYEEALGLWKRVLELTPGESLAYYNMGSIYLVLGKYGEALSVSKRAVELAPGRKEAVTNYATSELLAGEVSNAETVLRALEKVKPNFPIALALLAAISFIRGDNRGARRYFDKLGVMNFNVLPFILDTAKRLVAADRMDSALKLLDGAIQCGYSDREIAILKNECDDKLVAHRS
jgi:putative sugar O-methyltransferase